MVCAVCKSEAPVMEHHFFEGVAPAGRTRGEKPKREWTIVAPLYFKANEDNTAMVEGYCGPRCALAGFQ